MIRRLSDCALNIVFLYVLTIMKKPFYSYSEGLPRFQSNIKERINKGNTTAVPKDIIRVNLTKAKTNQT